MSLVETSVSGNPVWTINATVASEPHTLPALASGRNVTIRREDSVSGHTVVISVPSGHYLDGVLDGTASLSIDSEYRFMAINPGIWESYGAASGGGGSVTYGTTSGTAAEGNDSRITGAAQKSANLSDLASASTSRTNLGLGGAATLAVGTSSGTVAAGDDSRITGAALKSQNLADLANAGTARTNLGLGGAATLAVGTTAGTVAAGDDSRIVGAAQSLTRTTSVKTTSYTAAPGDLVPVDTTSGAVTITIPTAPADKSRVAVKHILQGGTNAVTIQLGGSDVINRTGGATSMTLSLLAQSAVLEYTASGAIWTVTSTDLPLSQLDLRFATPASVATAVANSPAELLYLAATYR